MPRPASGHRTAVALLRAETDRARGGAGRLVVVRGATGTGRTTVLDAAAEDAAARGIRTLRVRCSDHDTAHSFSAVRRLLAPVTEHDGPTTDTDEQAGADLLWRRLRGYADDGPVLLAVDDVHLADDASRSWLVEAARRIDRLPVLLAVTERSQYDVDPPSPGITHALAPGLVRTCVLAPLPAEAAAALAGSARPGASAAWLDACARAGAGSPLLLRALLEDLEGDPAEAVPETCAALYPGAYPQAVSWWLHSAGPMTEAVARTLAVLDEGRTRPAGAGGAGADDAIGLADLLAETAGADPSRVSGWLTAMTRLGVLRPDDDGRPRYAHPLFRDAVLTGAPTDRERAIRRRLARVLLCRGAGVQVVAGQLLRADTVGAPWGRMVLEEAAALASRDDRRDDAVALLRRALDEPTTDDQRQALLVELGSLEYAVGLTASALSRLAQAARLAGEPPTRMRAAVALGAVLAGLGKTRAAVDTLREAIGELHERPDLTSVMYSAVALFADEDRTVRQEVYDWLNGIAARSPGLIGTTAHALLARNAAAVGLTSADETMRRLRALLAEPADPMTQSFLVGTVADVAQWADELDEAERLVERGLNGQPPLLLHPIRDVLLDARADVLAARGDLAALLAEDAALPTAPGRAGVIAVQAHAVVALVETGRVREAARRLSGIHLTDARNSRRLLRFLYARGVLRMAEGELAVALHDFLEFGRRLPSREMVSPVVAPWRVAAVECHLALGNRQEALELAEEELRLAEVWSTPRTRGRALRGVAQATGGRHGLALAREAVRLLREAPAEADLVAALIVQGHLLISVGERGRARDSLREAAERAERQGAVRLRTRAEEALRTGGARRRASAVRTGVGALTGSERHVAELAADGRTNAEIAGLLHVALRTVETHLTSAYRKLGIKGRRELRESLNEGKDADG
ncbi:AAA family ATPase [Streptomyces sp. NPDC047061]|uniref:helix-turn-helix transcriptional regulator n=1 Tax=Streptomyces sp. NPDC047061 TaxID=3154605 RepID=UPI0033D7320C